MYKGGYQIIDLSGSVFTLDQEVKIDGIFETMTKATKPIMLSGFKCKVGAETDYARPAFVIFTTFP